MAIISERLKRIKPSPTLAVTTKAAELKAKGVDIIGLGAGEPDFDTPDNIKNAGILGIEQGKTKYTDVSGMPDLKKAICAKFKRENNLEYSPDQIIVSCGGKHVIYNAMMASLNPGDEVIIPAPYWVSYPDMVAIAEGVPVTIRGEATNEFKINPKQLEAAITNKTKWVILNSPSNPTGSTYTYDELKELANILIKYPDIYILSDDIYEHIMFDNFSFATIAQVEPQLYNRVLTVNGVSKAYSMTGWRLGYAGGPRELIKAMTTIQSQSTTNACSISQVAAIEALNGEQTFIKPHAELFQHRRDMAVEMLNNTKFLSCNKPTGAFYLFPDCSQMFGKQTAQGKILKNSDDVAEYLLEQAKVAVVQGSAFGMDGFFRISYATSDELLKEACTRIKNACEQLR